MDNTLISRIEQACQLAELINDPTCNVELRPGELRQLLNERAQLLEACKAIVDGTKQWGKYPVVIQITEESYNRVAAAIAAAAGEQP